jgi:hypothetical protein
VQVVNQVQRGGLNPRWGRIGFAVGAELVTEAQVDVARANESGVRGPQSGQRLANVPESLLHCARADADRAFGQTAVAVSLGEDLEDGDGVSERVEER